MCIRHVELERDEMVDVPESFQTDLYMTAAGKMASECAGQRLAITRLLLNVSFSGVVRVLSFLCVD